MMVCMEGQRIQVKMSAGPLPKFKNWQYLHKSNKNGQKKKFNTYGLAVTNYVVILLFFLHDFIQFWISTIPSVPKLSQGSCSWA